MASDSDQAIQFSIRLPRSLDTRIYARLSTQAKAIVLSLTTAVPDDLAAAKPMGSLVYALPNRFNEQQPLSTTLFSSESTLEFTTRLAKLVARRANLPVYVTNSISLESAGMGGTVEEEMEAFKNLVQVILAQLRDAGIGPDAANGDTQQKS